jgi:hypothetical protein
VVVGGLIGLLCFSVDAVATLIRFLFHPAVAERATVDAFLATLLYLPVFIVAGALVGYLESVRVPSLRYAFTGAIVGAVAWSYLTATWGFTARPTAFVPPDMSIPMALLIGAGGGGCGGLLLSLISGVRRGSLTVR